MCCTNGVIEGVTEGILEVQAQVNTIKKLYSNIGWKIRDDGNYRGSACRGPEAVRSDGTGNIDAAAATTFQINAQAFSRDLTTLHQVLKSCQESETAPLPCVSGWRVASSATLHDGCNRISTNRVDNNQTSLCSVKITCHIRDGYVQVILSCDKYHQQSLEPLLF